MKNRLAQSNTIKNTTCTISEIPTPNPRPMCFILPTNT